jgi:hypothetical protein
LSVKGFSRNWRNEQFGSDWALGGFLRSGGLAGFVGLRIRAAFAIDFPRYARWQEWLQGMPEAGQK